MHKKLHKDLYSKRNLQRKSLKPLNNKDKTSIIEDSEEVIEPTKYNKSNLIKYIGSFFIISLSLFGITQFSNVVNLEVTNDRNINISDVEIISNTTTSTISTTTTIPVSTTSTSTTIPIIVNNIEDAQSQLFNLGLYNAEIDGKNNSLTISAIKEFQKLAGLVVDGILGPKTQSSLEKGEESYVEITTNEPLSPTSSNGVLTVDLRNYSPNAPCINGYVNESQIWVPDPCFYPVFVFRLSLIHI